MLHEVDELLNSEDLSSKNSMLDQAKSILSQVQSMQMIDQFDYKTAEAILDMIERISRSTGKEETAAIDIIKTLYLPIKTALKSAEEIVKSKMLEYKTRDQVAMNNILKILDQDIKTAQEAGDLVTAELYAQRKRELEQRAITDQNKKNNEVRYDQNQSDPRSIDLVGQPV